MLDFSSLTEFSPSTSDGDITPYIIVAAVSFIAVAICVVLILIDKKKRK